MAAVRAGAVGLSKQPQFVMYSSTKGSDWDSLDNKDDKPTVHKNSAYSKRYGVSMTNAENVRQKWKIRRKLWEIKVKLCDVTLFLAMFGLVLAVIDVEIKASHFFRHTNNDFTIILGVLILSSTIGLLIALIVYHLLDTKIQLVETGTSNWRVVISRDRLFVIFIELVVCAICPIPVETGWVAWPFLSNDPHKIRQQVRVPVEVLLTLPMFLRFYIAGRYMVMHSSQHQDTATRTIASLNHISVDFRFVLKSEMYIRPLYVLSIASIVFWCIVSWMLTQCERYAYPNINGFQHFADYLWFEIITFFSIGYGDIQVNTFCGRGLAMLTAIVGTLFSSTLIALISRKLVLTACEKRVNHIIAENNITNEHKNAAARVLQNTWRTVLKTREYQKNNTKKNQQRLAAGQRSLLTAILLFQKTRWRLRMQMEEEDDYFTARRAFAETEERLQKVRQRQSQLDNKISQLFDNVESLTKIVLLNNYQINDNCVQ